jgi:error-prone DNA polymerase
MLFITITSASAAITLALDQFRAFVRVAGSVIVRQRAGTLKGFVFLSVEDEMGIFYVIITPDIFEHVRTIITRCHFLIVEALCKLQNSVVHIRFQGFKPLIMPNIEIQSHNFH